MKKKKNIKIVILIILIPIVFLAATEFICVQISKTDIYPKALELNLKENYEFKNYQLSNSKIMEIVEKTDLSVSLYENLQNREGWFEYYGDDRLYAVGINPAISYTPYVTIIEQNLKYNRKSTNKEDLKEYYKLNILYKLDNEYYDKNYYDRKEFIDKARIINQENNTFIIYPIAYSPPFIFGPQMESPFPSIFDYRYVENIFILYNDFVIQIKVYAHSKKNLTVDTIKYANKLLDQLYKASMDESYKVELLSDNEE